MSKWIKKCVYFDCKSKCKTFLQTLVCEDASPPCRIDIFRVLRQSFCGKFQIVCGFWNPANPTFRMYAYTLSIGLTSPHRIHPIHGFNTPTNIHPYLNAWVSPISVGGKLRLCLHTALVPPDQPFLTIAFVHSHCSVVTVQYTDRHLKYSPQDLSPLTLVRWVDTHLSLLQWVAYFG